MWEAIQDLETIVAAGRDAWQRDKFLRLAAQKLVEILGEAAKQVAEETRVRYPQIPWSDLSQVRDVYVHAYDRVDFELMRSQLEEQLGTIRSALADAMADLEASTEEE